MKDKSQEKALSNGHLNGTQSNGVNKRSSLHKNGIKRMSLHEEPLANSESFWEVGNYKRTVRRIDDGLTLCHQLMSMVKERGDLEVAYAKSLRKWSEKWAEHIDKSPEYGTLKGGWKGVLDEAEKQCNLHTRIKERLLEEVANTVKVWQKDNFHHKALGGLKEGKDVEEAFRKAQKPWAKLYAKVEKTKRDYHSACKAEKTAINQERNAQNDLSISQEKAKGYQDRVEKCREEREKCKTAYDHSLQEINGYNGKYMEDMTMVFEKCQEMEQKRMKFFKEMLFGVHKCLDVSSDAKLHEIYQDYHRSVDSVEPAQDLKWWEANCGTGMVMNWPEFEEYSDGMHLITKQTAAQNGNGTIAQNTIQLKGVRAEKFKQEFAEYSPELRPISKKAPKPETVNAGGVLLVKQRSKEENGPNHSPYKQSSSVSNQNGLKNGPSVNRTDTASPAPAAVTSNGTGDGTEVARKVTNQRSDTNTYGDDWDDETAASSADRLVDDGQPGLKVKALYDYAAQEADELTLTKGDIFEMVRSQDEQGWCAGRKNGKIGLYPADYAISC